VTQALAPSDLRIPHCEAGMRIGLFGGSFNPPHGGHLLVAETALRRLSLDRVWWMVTPGNPLKNHGELRPLADRIAASRALSQDRRIVVTGFEQQLGIAYTADTLSLLRARNPDVAFVWLMGADSLAGFHHWRDWQRIAATVPIAVIDRPGATLSPLHAPMAQRFGRARLPETLAASLPTRPAPCWVYLHGPRSSLSSTALRATAEP
jgi:nicotinate-nucleotide adenylyltransferase